jgi:hypothetical protein
MGGPVLRFAGRRAPEPSETMFVERWASATGPRVSRLAAPGVPQSNSPVAEARWGDRAAGKLALEFELMLEDLLQQLGLVLQRRE